MFLPCLPCLLKCPPPPHRLRRYPASRARSPLGAFELGLTYSGKAPVHRSGMPHVRNVTFEDIYIESAGAPGTIRGLPESCFDGLAFRNVTFGKLLNSSKWGCANVEAGSFVQEGVRPPFAMCANTPAPAGTCGGGADARGNK